MEDLWNNIVWFISNNDAVKVPIYAVIGLVLALVSQFSRKNREKRRGDRLKRDLQALQNEVIARQRKLDNIREEHRMALELKKIDEQQADAITSLIQREGRKDFWQGLIMNVIFFVFGVLASYFLEVYVA
jgi:hypothetical protein